MAAACARHSRVAPFLGLLFLVGNAGLLLAGFPHDPAPASTRADGVRHPPRPRPQLPVPVQPQVRPPGAVLVPVPRPAEAVWMQRHLQILAQQGKGGIDIVFVGDSITQGWLNSPVWNKVFVPMRAANFGINGDRVENVYWRLTQGGELRGINPRVLVLLIGTNNLSVGDDPRAIAEVIGLTVAQLRRQRPGMHIVLLGLFPRGQLANDPMRPQVQQVNQLLARLGTAPMVHYLDIGPGFVNADGSISPLVMADFVHPTPLVGYTIWAEGMVPGLVRLMRR